MHTVLHLANNKLYFAIKWDWGGGIKFHEISKLAMDCYVLAFLRTRSLPVFLNRAWLHGKGQLRMC